MGQHESKSSVEARVQVLLLGLDNAGKSTLLYKMKHNVGVSTVPTIGFNVEMLDARKNRKNISVTVWDVDSSNLFAPTANLAVILCK
uniref:Uncharacterized protein n=1 Tax=Xiphophorus couchianus TaxID=32473 RepID=A0A3B5KVM9_9TELE